jgi:adenosylmethionine-8-amino-7-oxononanoate aminotransferase
LNENTQNLLRADKAYVWHPFTQMAGWLESEPVIIDSAEGFYLIDTEGRRYIDGVSSLWCNVHGHRVKKIDDVIRAQVERVAHSTLLGLGQTKSIELAEKLIAIAPRNLKKVFYSDSGATAVEIALKIAYQYWHNRGQKSRTKFIALENSYHGDTVGSVSVGGIGLFHSIFRELLFETYFAPSPHPYRFAGTTEQCRDNSLSHIEELLKSHAGEVAAVIVEPMVQGAAGMIVHPAGFLKGVRELTKNYDVLMIADEVATGFGRTGKMFACEHEGVGPDLMCLAKGITGGYLPLAATLSSQEIFDAFLGATAEHKTFYHGHTFTGNALACAAAISSLELFEENRVLETMPAKIELMRDYFAEIAKLPHVGNVRQCGLMGGIELVEDVGTKKSFLYERQIGAKLCAAMRQKGTMMRPLGDVIVLMPAPAMEIGTLDKLLGIVHDAIRDELPNLVHNFKT